MIEVPPTHRVSAEYLAALLDESRRRTHELTADLGGGRLFGPKISIVNPALWEVGHVGFFHDFFALHRLFGLDHFQRPDAERLYDSSAIPHDDRWDLPLPTMDETWAYLRAVREQMLSRLPDGGLASEAVSYTYQLTTLHEDMHAEAFTYTRQTLGDPPPVLAGGGAVTCTCRGDSTCSARTRPCRSASTTRSSRTRSRSSPSTSPGRR